MESITSRLLGQRSFKIGLALQLLALLLLALPVVIIANGWIEPAPNAGAPASDTTSLKLRIVERTPILAFLAFFTAIALQVKAIRKVM